MPTRLRTVEDEVKSTASKPPGLDGVADLGRRRGRPDGPVGGDVVDLPAALGEAGGERLGGDVGAGQQHPADRVEDLVVRRELGQQALGGLLAGRDQLGLDAEGAHRLGGRLADAGDLDAAEVAGVEAVLGELLPDRADGVDAR